jgi:hypothetical protein
MTSHKLQRHAKNILNAKQVNLIGCFLLIFVACSIILLALIMSGILAIILNTPTNSGVSYLVLVIELLFLVLFLIYACESLRRSSRFITKSLAFYVYESSFKSFSFVKYIWFSLIIAPIFVPVDHTIQKFFGIFSEASYLKAVADTSYWPYVALSFAFFVLYITVLMGQRSVRELQFSPGATLDDKFNYRPVANSDMRSLISLDQALTVCMINGRIGEGKSSYLRMMIDSRPQSEMLYTYISLTETNEAASFSKLFATRWAQTIQARYPTIINSSKNSILQNIFRDSGNQLLKVLSTFMEQQRWPLKQTKLKYTGENYSGKKYAGNELASLFGYIPEFFENYWVIVIDEIERSKFDEIYRVIETLERFRMEAQYGLPIKIIFVLCVDRQRMLERYSEPVAAIMESSSLTHSFMEKEPKSIDIYIELPPISPDLKEQFIINAEKTLIGKYGIDDSELMHPDENIKDYRQYWRGDLLDVRKDLLDDKKANDFAIDVLMSESPRIIKKVFEEVDNWYQKFLKSEGQRDPNQIRISDIIILIFLKIKYPTSVQFLKNIHPQVFPNFYVVQGGETESIMRAFRTNDQDKTDLKELYLKFSRTNIPNDSFQLPSLVENCLLFLCYPLIKHLETLNNKDSRNDYEYSTKQNYINTLSLPENLWDALTFATDSVSLSSTFITTTKKREYCLTNKKLPKDLQDNNYQLLAFAKDIRRYYPNDIITSEIITERLARLIVIRNEIAVEPAVMRRQTSRDDSANEFTFHLSNYLSNDSASSTQVHDAYHMIKKIIESKHCPIESKITIIDNLFVYSQTAQSNTSYELNKARARIEDIYAVELKHLIESFTANALATYDPINKQRKSIYDYEENYFYVIYQLWSGNPDDVIELEKIRRIASYKLANKPEIIDSYWNNKFKLNESMSENPSFPLDLNSLIDITKKAGLYDHYLEHISYWQNQPDHVLKIPIAQKQRGFSTLIYQLRTLKYI